MACLQGCMIVGLGTAPVLRAQTMIWQGGPGVGNSDTWHIKPSWNSTTPNANQTAQFDNSAPVDSVAPSIGTTATSVGSIVFAGGTTHAFDIGGSSVLTIGSATVAGITNLSSTNQQLSVSTISLGVSQTWNIAGTGNLTLTSNVSSAGNMLTLLASNSGVGLISGAINGAGGIVKSGPGTWTLSGDDNYSGGTTVTAGRLIVSGAKINVGPVIVSIDGMLQIDGNATLPFSTSLTLHGGTLTFGGAFSQILGTPLNLTSSSTIDFGNGIGASSIAFGNSSAQNWGNSALTISNYNSTSDTLRFGTGSDGIL